MRVRVSGAAVAVMLAAATVIGCSSRRGLFRQYEYEEEIYLALDGTATVYVNASLPSLNALRGTSFDIAPNAPVDRAAVRRYFSAPHVRLGAVSFSRRSNRRFVHVRLDVDDVSRLSEAPPFSWSTYHFGRVGAVYVYRQVLGAAAGREVGDVGWTGGERVAFRLHLPSTITSQNSVDPPERGNILTWEQPLARRIAGEPVELEAQMETQSILYRTLWLFGVTFFVVAACFVVVIWWILRRGAKPAEV